MRTMGQKYGREGQRVDRVHIDGMEPKGLEQDVASVGYHKEAVARDRHPLFADVGERLRSDDAHVVFFVSVLHSEGAAVFHAISPSTTSGVIQGYERARADTPSQTRVRGTQ